MTHSSISLFPNEHFMDLTLYQYGWEKCAPLHSYGPYVRNHYLFHYVLSGSGTLVAKRSDGSQHNYRIRSGEGFMIFPQQITTYYADLEHPWEYTWIEFNGLKAGGYLELAGISEISPIYHAMNKSASQALRNEVLYITGKPEKSPLQLIGHTYLFLDLLVNSSLTRKMNTKENLKDFYIREAVSFLEQHYQDDISIEDLAQFCGLNRSYFSKIFKGKTGQTPQEFLIRYRMDKATQLLKLSSLSIHDISMAVGYPNPLHFSRAFKNVCGISPRQWRSEHKIS